MTGPAQSPLLTVVTVTFRDEEGFGRTLDSLHSQDVLRSEPALVQHVVIDADSSEIVREAFRGVSRPWDLYVGEPDRGIYDGMNKGLRRAAGTYLQFLNSGDTYQDSASLGHVISRLQQVRPTWAICGAVNGGGGAGVPFVIENMPHSFWRHAVGRQVHCHQACFFSRDLLAASDGHAEEFGFAGDFDLVMRSGMVARPLEIPRVCVAYEGGGLSADRSREIPRLQADVRESRMQLSGAARRLNRAYARVLEAQHEVRLTRAGRADSSYGTALRRLVRPGDGQP